MEMVNTEGMVVDILADSYLPAGSHMVTWQSMDKPAGLFFTVCVSGETARLAESWSTTRSIKRLQEEILYFDPKTKKLD